MNTKDIEYYVQIVKQKNFTKVANYFRVSQPTITYALQRLEKEFDTVLITRDRSHHDLIVTPSGKQLFLHAQTILQEISTARAEITQLQKKKLRFGMPPIIGNEYFPKLSSYFIKHELMNQIEITDGGSRDLYGMNPTREDRFSCIRLNTANRGSIFRNRVTFGQTFHDRRATYTSSFQAGYCLFQRYSR